MTNISGWMAFGLSGLCLGLGACHAVQHHISEEPQDIEADIDQDAEESGDTDLAIDSEAPIDDTVDLEDETDVLAEEDLEEDDSDTVVETDTIPETDVVESDSGEAPPDHDDDHDDSVSSGDEDEAREAIDWERAIPWALPACDQSNLVPCELPFEAHESSEPGVWRLGPEPILTTVESGPLPRQDIRGAAPVWSNSLVYWVSGTTQMTSGVIVFDLARRQSIKVLAAFDGGLYPGAGSSLAAWTFQSPTSGFRQYGIQTISLTNDPLVVNRVLPSDRARSNPRLKDGDGSMVYFLDQNADPQNYNRAFLSRVDAQGRVFTFDHRFAGVDPEDGADGIGVYDVHGKYAAYSLATSYAIGVLDLDTGTPSRLSPVGMTIVHFLSINDSMVYWSGYPNDSEKGFGCGPASIYATPITGGPSTVLVNGADGDKLVDGTWGDWLVYSDYSRGNPYLQGGDITSGCARWGARGQVILRHLSSGREWTMSQGDGDQASPRIWGPLVTWIDSRAIPGDPGRATSAFIRDLCVDPELGPMFSECALRGPLLP